MNDTIDYRSKILLSLSIVLTFEKTIVIDSKNNISKGVQKGKRDQEMQGQMSFFTCLLPVTHSKYSYALDKT